MDEVEKAYEEGCALYIVEAFEEAIDLFRFAAERGHAEAQCKLGDCYYNGKGVDFNGAEAFKWYMKAAKQGNAEAQYSIGFYYSVGESVEKDEEEAAKWYAKAAIQGHVKAQCTLAECFLYGEGVSENGNEAIRWFTKAAEQDDTYAQYKLGLCYEDGIGVARNYSEAISWYRKAAERGQSDAQYKLAYYYQYDAVVDKSEREAVRWYLKSAEQGNMDAQYHLGHCYFYGFGVEASEKEAVKWFRKAAEQGQAKAQESIAYCYSLGKGIKTDNVKATEWYRKAAEQGNISAQGTLARRYYNGEGVETDYAEALKWYKKAAVGSPQIRGILSDLSDWSKTKESILEYMGYGQHNWAEKQIGMYLTIDSNHAEALWFSLLCDKKFTIKVKPDGRKVLDGSFTPFSESDKIKLEKVLGNATDGLAKSIMNGVLRSDFSDDDSCLRILTTCSPYLMKPNVYDDVTRAKIVAYLFDKVIQKVFHKSFNCLLNIFGSMNPDKCKEYNLRFADKVSAEEAKNYLTNVNEFKN